MGGEGKKRAAKPARGRRLGGQEMATFVAALEEGGTVAQAAKAAGCCAMTAYNRRKTDPLFAESWAEAVERSNRPWLIAPKNGRKLQKWKPRPMKFTAERKAAYLAHFAATCDADAAARAVGVGDTTVYTHRKQDPDFGAAWEQALGHGYQRLEAELARQLLAAAKAMQAAVEAGAAVPGSAQEFERGLALLKLYNSRRGRPEPRTRAARGERKWSFAEAVAALEKKLRALGYEVDEDQPERPDDDLAA